MVRFSKKICGLAELKNILGVFGMVRDYNIPKSKMKNTNHC